MTHTAPHLPVAFRRRGLPVVVALAVCALLTACETTESGPPPPPTVSGIDRTTVSPGDTVRVTGSGFDPDVADNTVTFANPVATAVPFVGSTTALTVVVPRDATSGAIKVTIAEQEEPGVGPRVSVPARGVGEVWLYGADDPLELPFPTPAAKYLLVPHGSNPAASYSRVDTFTIDAGSAPPPALSGAVGAQPVVNPADAFHFRMLDAIRDIARTAQKEKPAQATPARSAAQQRQFFVLNDPNRSIGSASSYDQITATLRYNGTHVLVYADDDTLSQDNFTQANYNDFGTLFDNQIYATNRTHFGNESDVDGNGKVILLFTPVVNRFTPPNSPFFFGGFYNPQDLFAPGQVTAGTTNRGEILYMLAADPKGDYGNAFEMQFLIDENKTTSAHEFEHLISAAQRLFNFGGVFQASWLEEGMAHMAEDLNGLNDSNLRRGSRYLEQAGSISIEFNLQPPITQRGGIYLFLRWLADRFGEDIFVGMVRSKTTGRSTVQLATGENFYFSFSGFLAALYLTDRGIATDPTYEFTSLDLLNDFSPLLVSTWTVAQTPVGGHVRRSAGEFHIFTDGAALTEFTFSASAVARLRTTVVRIE